MVKSEEQGISGSGMEGRSPAGWWLGCLPSRPHRSQDKPSRPTPGQPGQAATRSPTASLATPLPARSRNGGIDGDGMAGG